jgi:isopenicillin N synthase-like dioxygenase
VQGRGFLTLILQDSVGGLEVQDRGGRWVGVKALEGALVVNCGDYLALLARQLSPPPPVHSPVHRVVSPVGGCERYSFVFFAYPSYTAPLPSPTTALDHGYNTLLHHNDPQSGEGPALTFGEHLGRKWAGVQTQPHP